MERRRDFGNESWTDVGRSIGSIVPREEKVKVEASFKRWTQYSDETVSGRIVYRSKTTLPNGLGMVMQIAPLPNDADGASKRPSRYRLMTSCVVCLSLCGVLIFCPAAIAENAGTLTVEPVAVAFDSAWNELQVIRWAAAHSPKANAIASERTAVLATLDRNDRSQCQQWTLLQQVTQHWEAHQRQQSAADALVSFYKLTYARQQLVVLSDAETQIDSIVQLMKSTESLELSNSDRVGWQKRQLELVDQKVQLLSAIGKLEVGLSLQTGKTVQEIASAQWQVNPPARISRSTEMSIESLRSPIAVDDLVGKVKEAHANRRDLQALETLCASLNEDSLPAARQWLATLQPGLGLVLAVASKRGLLGALHHGNDTAGDLCRRKEQCTLLASEARDAIESEVRIAMIDNETAIRRYEVARQLYQISLDQVRTAETAIELGQAAPATVVAAKLQSLQSSSELIQRESDVAVADVNLRRSTGTIAIP